MEVEFAGVRFAHADRPVLDIPALRVQGGRTTAILGPNGSGKTTLLRLIAGLERPLEGRVLVGGSPVGAGTPAQPRVAYVFQEQVFLRRSVRENLELGPRLRGVGNAETRRRVDEAADLLGIAQLLARRADQLSGGEGRRASLARALCLQAPLVLLDEPLAGLDGQTYARLLDELPQILSAFGGTTLLVTHDRYEALSLAQDLVVLVDGRVRAAGDKRAVVMQPTVAAVAEVLGYSVLLSAGRRVAVAPGALTLGPGGVEFPLVVEDVLDLVDYLEVVGMIGGVRVHARLRSTSEAPRRGEQVIVHAERASDLESD